MFVVFAHDETTALNAILQHRLFRTHRNGKDDQLSGVPNFFTLRLKDIVLTKAFAGGENQGTAAAA